MRRRQFKIRHWVGVAAAVSVPLALGAARAEAVVVGAAPTWPIASDAPVAPPLIPALPAATDQAPPPDQIADPVTPAASCGGWYLQNSYGDRWPAGSTWWEYRCSREDAQYHNTCPGPACNAYCPDCFWETQDWTDYFYWDGSSAGFYGQAYSDSVLYDYQSNDWPPTMPFVSSDWWDAPTAQWYDLGPYLLAVSNVGTGSGEVASNPGGISCGYSCEASLDASTAVTLTATPDASSTFTGWSGDCSGTGACQVTMDQARSVTATFALRSFALTVSKQGAGSGQVSSSPAGISCGGSCQASFDTGTAVTLTATPDSSSIFTGWSGDCAGTGPCQVTIDQARSVTATFALRSFALTVSKQGAGSGQVGSSPAGISCGGSCQASFDTGTAVTLTATQDSSFIFTGWSGDCAGTGSCQVTIDQARSVTATFVPNAPPRASFTFTCTGLSCSFDGSGSRDSDGTITSYGWRFGDSASGSGSGETVSHTYSRAGSYTVTLNVIDSAGATASASKAVNPISFSARGYKQNGLQKVDLSWSGPSGASFDVYRNSAKIATVQATAYTDNINQRGSGAYTYRVCAHASSTCSNDVSVSF